MPTISLVPSPRTRVFVERLWWSRRDRAAQGAEYALPNGRVHLVVALHDASFGWTAADGGAGRWSGAVVHGPHAAQYRTEPKPAGAVFGVSFRPGAAGAVLGAPASEFAHRHVPLEALWGSAVESLRARLEAAATPEAALAELERTIAARLRRPLLMHAVVTDALDAAQRADHPFRLREFASDRGRSEKFVIARFHESVGLTPGRYFRVQRFGNALRALATSPRPTLAALAIDLGYADQAHLTRDFRELGGITPARYQPPDAERLYHYACR